MRATRARFGFAGIGKLRQPGDWDALASEALADVAACRAAAVAAEDPRRALRLVDRMSNALCAVLDPAELCRSADARPEWRSAAHGAFRRVAGAMEALNVDRGVYAAVRCAARETLPFSAAAAAASLAAEFERDGCALENPGDRAAAAARRRELHDLEFAAAQPWDDGGEVWRVPCGDAAAVARAVAAAYGDGLAAPSADGASVDVRGHGAVVDAALGASRDRAARKLLWERHAAAVAASEGAARVDALAAARAAAAQALGFESHAALALGGPPATLVGGVAGALDFLGREAARVAPAAAAERAAAAALVGVAALEPWDAHLGRQLLLASAPAPATWRREDAVDAVVRRATAELFPGVAARDAALAPGEAWADGVTKVELFDGGALAGAVFLDLVPRPGKPPAPALYAVRCGCDVDGGAPLAAPDGRAVVREAWGLQAPARQPAAAALVASLPEVVGAAELASLAHEWGHALHAALASSTTQHLSGTRGATDVAELPSTAFEALAGREKTLRFLFRGDGAAAAAHAAAAAARRGKTAATDAAHQLALAYFDLELHGPAPPPYFAAAEAAARRVGHGRVDPRPFADVAHVVSAPATYYAYAYDRRLAEQRFADLDAGAPSLLAFLRAASEAPDPRGLLLGGT